MNKHEFINQCKSLKGTLIPKSVWTKWPSNPNGAIGCIVETLVYRLTGHQAQPTGVDFPEFMIELKCRQQHAQSLTQIGCTTEDDILNSVTFDDSQLKQYTYGHLYVVWRLEDKGARIIEVSYADLSGEHEQREFYYAFQIAQQELYRNKSNTRGDHTKYINCGNGLYFERANNTTWHLRLTEKKKNSLMLAGRELPTNFFEEA